MVGGWAKGAAGDARQDPAAATGREEAPLLSSTYAQVVPQKKLTLLHDEDPVGGDQEVVRVPQEFRVLLLEGGAVARAGHLAEGQAVRSAALVRGVADGVDAAGNGAERPTAARVAELRKKIREKKK